MFDFLPSAGQVQDLWHATSWTWFGASALLAAAGVLLVIVPVVRNIQAAILCFALAAGTSYMGTLYTQRDLARAEAVRVGQEFIDFKEEARLVGEKRAAEESAKEKDRETKFQSEVRRKDARIAELNRHLSELRSRPPVDPSGREIGTTTCGPSTPDAVPTKLVSLTEYLALQERAAQDVNQLIALQDYLLAQGLTVK